MAENFNNQTNLVDSTCCLLISSFASNLQNVLNLEGCYFTIFVKSGAIKHSDMIESVLRRATKVVPHLKDLSYEERLRHLKLPSMQYRRERGDMIEVYKFTHGLYPVNKGLLELDRKQIGTRGHMFKLAKKKCRINIRQNVVSFRVVDKWNNLPAAVVEAPSLDSFKNRLDTHWATLKYCV